MTKDKFKRKTFLKGLLMGLCDLVPGISAGTIAFITGIYERLITAIKGFSPSLAYNLITFNKQELSQDIKRLDLKFLATLVSGILIAIIFFSKIILFLLESYFSFTMIFFVGLILASAKTIFDHIERHHSMNTAVSLVGLALGVSLAFLIPANVQPTVWYVFLGGFLAISAMVLPGISGSFILLILGVYSFMLESLHDLPNRINYVLAFIVGAILGLVVISRIVSLLFKKDKSKTLYFLLGLVIGGLSVPIREIYHTINLGTVSVIVHIVIFFLGILAAYWIKKLAKRGE